MLFLLDLSVNIFNRTAVYDIGNFLADAIPERNRRIRYWRFFSRKPVLFRDSPWLSFVGKAAWRLASRDLDRPGLPRWPRFGATAAIFVDPIFCGRTRLRREDIVICHDVGPISNPEYYDEGASQVYNGAYLAIQKAACRIVFVSEFTKREYLKLYPAEYRKTDVIPPIFKSVFSEVETLPAPTNARPYFLMVSGLEKRKNVSRAIKSFLQSAAIKQGFDLVIVGLRYGDPDKNEEVIGNSSQIRYLGFVPNSQLKSLYLGAEALLFPSLLEGFGVPALEAPVLNCLPIVSKGTVLEEVVGPGGVFVDPTSESSIAEGIDRVCAMTAEEKSAALTIVKQHQTQFSRDHISVLWQRVLADEGISS